MKSRVYVIKNLSWILPLLTLFVGVAMISQPVYATDPVVLIHAWPKWRRIDASKCNQCIDPFYATVRNPNPDGLLIRVVWGVWAFPSMEALGSLEVEGYMDPPPQTETFTVDFDIWDPRWGFDGATRMDYEVKAEVFYVDYYVTPGVPHWARGTCIHACWFQITVLP